MLKPKSDVRADHDLDEVQIRADERARVEEELRSIADGSDASSRHDDPGVDQERERHATAEHRRGDAEVHDRDAHDAATVVPAPVDQERERHATAEHRRGDAEVHDRDDHGPATEVPAPVDQQPAAVEVVRRRSFSVGQLLSLLVGAALVVLGAVTLFETGVERPLDQPVEQVMGYGHTPLLGIFEVVAGGLLLLFSLRPGGRWFVALVGLGLIVGGLLILAPLDWVVDELGAEDGYAWIPIVAGGLALLAALLTPRRYQRMTGVPTTGRS
jgi:hypothetical protein